MYIFLLGSIASFLATLLITPFLIHAFKERGIVGRDVHKLVQRECAEMGGVAVLIGFSVGFGLILLFTASVRLVLTFLTIVLVGVVGVADDLLTLRQRYKPFLVALASLPLVFVSFNNAHMHELWLPFVGAIFVGPFFVFLIPLGVTTAANMTNMLAGFNGLESGIGAISCFGLGIACYLSGANEAALIAFLLSAAFLAFLRYNWYPAKIFPGDTGTLTSGAAIAAISILGGVEGAGLFTIVPCAIDFTLKMISKRPFSQRSLFGNTRISHEKKLIASSYRALPHAFMRAARLGEKELVSWILIMQVLYSALAVSIILLSN